MLQLSDASVRQRLHRARQVIAERLRPELCEAESITCGGQLDLLFDYLDDLLGADVRVPVIDHVTGCDTCQTLASKYRSTIRAPRDVPVVIEPSAIARVIDSVRTAIAREVA